VTAQDTHIRIPDGSVESSDTLIGAIGRTTGSPQPSRHSNLDIQHDPVVTQLGARHHPDFTAIQLRLLIAERDGEEFLDRKQGQGVIRSCAITVR
jgi:hypothetical protein